MVERGTENPCVGGSIPSLATIFPAALAAAAALFVWLPAGQLYFAADDFEWLRAAEVAARRGGFTLPADVNGHFRPLAEALWLLEWKSFGLDPRPYHLVAVLLHAATAWLVAVLAGRLAGEPWAGLAAGVAFASSFSLRTVPTWVSASSDLLLGAAATAAIVLAGSGRARLRRLALAAAAAAVLAKETGVLVPLIVALVEPRWVRERWVRPGAAGLLVAGAALHLRAALASPYVQDRFGLGRHLPGRWLEAAASLAVDPVVLADSPAARRAVAGAALGVMLGILARAARRVGRFAAARWAGAVALALLPAACATTAVESRWLYLPAALAAPLLAAALPARGGRWSAGAVRAAAAAAAGLLLAVNTPLARIKIARERAAGEWVREVVEGAPRGAPALADGQAVEVVVPFGAELRHWPVGFALALGRDISVVPVDDRSGPSGRTPVYDASRHPTRWR